MLYSIRDLNGNGVADLMTLSSEGRSILRQRSVYTVHFGSQTGNGISFPTAANLTIRPPGNGRGTVLGYSFLLVQDADTDGNVDIILGNVKTGLGGMYRALVANSIPMDLALYRSATGMLPNTPTLSRSIRPKSDIFGRRGPFFPTVLLGDVTGDGRKDLLVGESRKQLQVFVGIRGQELFAAQPRTVAVDLPDDETKTRLMDLNGNGKQDIIVHHASTREPHRLQILMAR